MRAGAGQGGAETPCTWSPSSLSSTGARAALAMPPECPLRACGPNRIRTHRHCSFQRGLHASLLHRKFAADILWLRPSPELLNLLVWAGDKGQECFSYVFHALYKLNTVMFWERNLPLGFYQPFSMGLSVLQGLADAGQKWDIIWGEIFW